MDAPVPDGRSSGTAHQLAGVIEGVGARHHHISTTVEVPSHVGKQRGGLRQGVLLA